jgi:hypothetical protein
VVLAVEENRPFHKIAAIRALIGSQQTKHVKWPYIDLLLVSEVGRSTFDDRSGNCGVVGERKHDFRPSQNFRDFRDATSLEFPHLYGFPHHWNNARLKSGSKALDSPHPHYCIHFQLPSKCFILITYRTTAGTYLPRCAVASSPQSSRRHTTFGTTFLSASVASWCDSVYDYRVADSNFCSEREVVDLKVL